MKLLNASLLIIGLFFTSDALTQTIDMNQLLLNASQSGDVGIIRHAHNEGADINVKNDAGETVLHLASSKGHVEAVRALLTAGAEIDAISDIYFTSLTYAASQGHEDVAQVLIDAEANINGGDRYSYSRPLAYASIAHNGCNKSYTNIVQRLLDAGARVNAQRNYGWTALADAIYSGCIETVRVLLDKGANPNLTFTANLMGSFRMNFNSVRIKPQETMTHLRFTREGSLSNLADRDLIAQILLEFEAR